MEQLQVSPMQPSKMNVKPNIGNLDDAEHDNEPGSEEEAELSSSAEPAAGKLLADSIEQGKSLLNEHKGKLAIGVAATLGLMVFYKWRDKKLAEEDPEEYARLQRIKAVVREQDANDAESPRRMDEDE